MCVCVCVLSNDVFLAWNILGYGAGRLDSEDVVGYKLEVEVEVNQLAPSWTINLYALIYSCIDTLISMYLCTS